MNKFELIRCNEVIKQHEIFLLFTRVIISDIKHGRMAWRSDWLWLQQVWKMG